MDQKSMKNIIEKTSPKMIEKDFKINEKLC